MKNFAKLLLCAWAVMLPLAATAQCPSGRNHSAHDSSCRQGREKVCNDKNWRKIVKSQEIAFITGELDLSPEEAQIFWPVYNKEDKEHAALMKEVHETFGKLRQAIEKDSSDAETASLLRAYSEALEKASKLSSKYLPEYEKVLPEKKIAKLYIARESFRKMQIRKLGGNHGRESQKR